MIILFPLKIKETYVLEQILYHQILVHQQRKLEIILLIIIKWQIIEEGIYNNELFVQLNFISFIHYYFFFFFSKHFVRVESKTNSPSIRNAHNIRASSVESETTSDKLTEKQNNELIKTSIKTKRQSLLIPSEITVTKEKEESMKLSRITLNRTLSDINENIQSGILYLKILQILRYI